MTFVFKPSPRSRLHADRATANGRPAVWLSLHGTDGRGAAVFIDVDHLEEVVAGLRDMARQAGGLRVDLGGQDVTEHAIDPAAALAGAPLTAEQHARVRELLPEGVVITAAGLRDAADSDVAPLGDFLEMFGLLPKPRAAEPWPSRERWRVETLDPVANEWSSGSSTASRAEALARRTHAEKLAPRWLHDGSTVQRRIVRETVTYSVEES